MSQSALRLVKLDRASTNLSDLSELRLTIKEFLNAAKPDHQPRTIGHYEWHLNRLASWLAARGVTRPADVTRLLLREWGVSLYDPYEVRGKRRVWGQEIIKQATTAARSFFGWCAKERYCADDLAEVLKIPRIKKKQYRTLSEEEVSQLHSVCDTDRAKGKRDRALLGLLLDSGLRSAEICRAEIGAIEYGVIVGNEKVNRVKVVIKGGAEEYGHFSDQTAAYLRDWLEVRLAAPGVETIFVSVGGFTPGHSLTGPGLDKVLAYLGKKAGVKGVSPHTFRRTFAVMLTLLGVPSRAVQVLGRWSDIRMVERYTAGLVAGKLFSQYKGRLWGQNQAEQ